MTYREKTAQLATRTRCIIYFSCTLLREFAFAQACLSQRLRCSLSDPYTGFELGHCMYGSSFVGTAYGRRFCKVIDDCFGVKKHTQQLQHKHVYLCICLPACLSGREVECMEKC